MHDTSTLYYPLCILEMLYLKIHHYLGLELQEKLELVSG
jgi:hypothetical protein